MKADALSRWVYDRLAAKYAPVPSEEPPLAPVPLAEPLRGVFNRIIPAEDRHKEHSHRWVRRGGETTAVGGTEAKMFNTYVCIDCQLGELREA